MEVLRKRRFKNAGAESPVRLPGTAGGWLAAALVILLLGAHSAAALAGPVTTNTDFFQPVATPAHAIKSLALFVLTITGGIWLVMMGLLLFVTIRYRSRPGDPATEPPQVFGSNQIEAAWTIIPILGIIVLFLTTARTIFAIQDAPRPKQALDVTVIGHQFWWEFRYPKLGIVTANELHLPVAAPGSGKATYLSVTSADVVHSFWIPRLAGKTDAIPNRVNYMWLDPYEAGLYLGQCTQFCGVEHAKMLLRVYADPPEKFAAWVKNQQQPAAEDPAVAAGRQAFESQACINCHTVTGTVANGRFGPDLTHLMSRETLASGVVPNNEAMLKQWIRDPDSIKPGSLMPPMHLTPEQLDEITAFLRTLR